MSEAYLLHEIRQDPDGLYRWECPVDPHYFRQNLLRWLKRFALGALVFAALGLIPSLVLGSWGPVQTSALWAAAFLALTALVSGLLLLLVHAPTCRYELSGDYICQPASKGSTYFHFKDAQSLTIYPDSLELRCKWIRMRIFVPEADFPFVLDYIRRRVPEQCEIHGA